MPSAIIEIDGSMSDDEAEELISLAQDKLTGEGNNGKIFISEPNEEPKIEDAIEFLLNKPSWLSPSEKKEKLLAYFGVEKNVIINEKKMKEKTIITLVLKFFKECDNILFKSRFIYQFNKLFIMFKNLDEISSILKFFSA